MQGVNWYTSNSGGPIATGNSFTTPTINTTTSYYVDATNEVVQQYRVLKLLNPPTINYPKFNQL
jgi:hypothetical protein